MDELEIAESRVTCPMVPIRDVVVFPRMMVPFVIGRASSILALEKALLGDKKIYLATQMDATEDDPAPDQIYQIGTVAAIVQSLKLPDGNIRVLVEGLQRARCLKVDIREGYCVAEVEYMPVPSVSEAKLSVLAKRLHDLFEQFSKINTNVNYESVIQAAQGADNDRLADSIAASLPITVEEKQSLLEMTDSVECTERVCELIEIEIEKIKMDKSIHGRVRKQMEKAQREYYLNEKIKAIQKELGRSEKDEIEELKEKIEEAKFPADAKEKAENEIRRLEQMPPMSAETTVSRTYLDWLLAIPWNNRSREIRDIKKATKILDADHYGLRKVKDRVLEFLAVRELAKRKKQGSILCFVGPPGVGKTSLGRSIARATGRKFVRLSLGGVRDEAEVRGHRRTYIGALPGQIVQMMKRAGVKNPVMLLDEIDKMSVDFRGDPSSALMEVLDPEHNSTFVDHYLDTELDLSQVLFICTANVLHTIPGALQDRMEVIEISGYTEYEKTHIAKKFLIPKQREIKGFREGQVEFLDEALTKIVQGYTRESGVRNLEREIGSVFRKIARRVVEKDKKSRGKAKYVVDNDLVLELLGPNKFRSQMAGEKNEIGIATGLAVTEVGGEVLFTECTSMVGKGDFLLTGKLGEVMQESAKAALSYVRARATRYGLAVDFHKNLDIHIHVPDGAIPKDGPSAGITLVTALTSCLTGIPVKKDLAMTGEITLRGRVMPIGGLKEKVLAAHRAGIKTVIVPEENRKDIRDIPASVQEELDIVCIEWVDDVLELAMERSPISGGDGEGYVTSQPPPKIERGRPGVHH
jgi:ATP-dependent Lon protease